MKKMLVVFLSFVMILAMAAPAFAANYSDLAGCTTAQKTAIDNLSKWQIVNGYSDNSFKPEGNITRAEFAKIAVQSYIKYTGNDAFTELYFEFNDIQSGAWYDNWVQKACNAGLMQGCGDNTFRPNAEITGQEAVTVVLRIMGYQDKDLTGSWPKNYMDKAADLGVLEDISANFSDPAKRADVCVLVDNMLKADKTVKYGVVSSISDKTVKILDMDGVTREYALAAADGVKANRLVAYTLNADKTTATLSANGVNTNDQSNAAVSNGKVKLSGNEYEITEDTKIYMVSGSTGKLTGQAVDANAIRSNSLLQATNSSNLKLDIQYTLKGDKVDILIIGGYSSGNALQFGFIEKQGIYSADLDYGVQMFCDSTVYDKSSRSAETLEYNVLYQYSVRNNEITLNPVDIAKEQIKDGEIVSLGDDLYNTRDAQGAESQFIVTEDTVIIHVTMDKNDVDEVEYGYKLSKGDVVNVRYNVKNEDDREAAYVIVYEYDK